MQAFFAAIVACVAIGVGAHFALDSLERTSANASASDYVRLN